MSTYSFNGTEYKTREEAEKAREQYIQNRVDSVYADAASVGFDKDRYNALMESGSGLSQMTQSERDYITKRYAPTASTKYTNSDTDQYLASVGLPPSKELSKYRTKYREYTATGGLNDNYKNISKDQWSKINELWSQDWQYGLTDEDARRQQLGLAPVSFDADYDDTLLDDELKAAGLPPSKLLSGKLGERYNSWVKDTNSYNEFMSAVALDYYHSSEKYKDKKRESVGAPELPSSGNDREYTMQDAINTVLASGKYDEFANTHFNILQDVPDEHADAYLAKDEKGLVLRDENGQNVYDYGAWWKDRQKAVAHNAAIENDEFAITAEKAQTYYQKYANYIIAKEQTDAMFVGKRVSEAEYVNEYADQYNTLTFNDGNGFTVDMLFPDASEEEKAFIAPMIEKANGILNTSGYNDAVNYLNGGGFTKDVIKAQEDEIVAAYRQEFSDVKSVESKTDEQILDAYYDKYKTYGMTDADIKKMRSGELSFAQFMGARVKNSKDAETFASDRHVRELQAKGLPTTREELQKLYERRRDTELETSRVDSNRMNMSDEEFEKNWQVSKDFLALYPTWEDAEDAGFSAAVWEQYKNDYDAYEAADYRRKAVRDADPEYYQNGISSKEIESALKLWSATETAYYLDAAQYTDEFKNATQNKDYVDAQFEKIVDEFNKGLSLGEDIALGIIAPDPLHNVTTAAKAASGNLTSLQSYATDEEKRKLVYLYETSTKDHGNYGAVKTTDYLNNVLFRTWDAKKQDEIENKQDWYKNTNSGFLKVLGGIGSTLAAISLQPFEAGTNLTEDTKKMILGKELYVSDRSNWSDNQISIIAKHIAEDSGDGWATAYQMIPSMVQSAGGMVAAYFTGGWSEAITLAAMATQAYSSTVNEALANGASSKEAFAYGIASGVNEALFEKVSLDAAFSGMTGVADVVKNVSKASRKEFISKVALAWLKQIPIQGFVEASEETFTSLANLFAESTILGLNSSGERMMQHYIDGGMSEEDAAKQVILDNLKSIGMDALLGFVSGAMMSMGDNAIVAVHETNAMRTRTAIERLATSVNSISGISYDNAIKMANEVAEFDTDNNLTMEGAQKVVEALRGNGVDAAVLARVTNAITTENTSADVMTYLNSEVGNVLSDNKATIIDAAAESLKGSNPYGLSKEHISAIAQDYMNEVSNAIQKGDEAHLANIMSDMQNGFVAEVARRSGVARANGAAQVGEYIARLSEEEKAQVLETAKRFRGTFAKSSRLNGNAVDYYADTAAALAHAVDMTAPSNADFARAATMVFDRSAGSATTAVENICLNSSGDEARAFVDAVLEGIANHNGSDTHALMNQLSAGMSPAHFVTASLALAAQKTEDSTQKALYNYAVKYGTSESLLNLLAVANKYDTMNKSARSAAENDVLVQNKSDAVMTADQAQALADEYNKLLDDFYDKQEAVKLRRKSNAVAMRFSESQVVKYQEESDALHSSETYVDENGNTVQTTDKDLANQAVDVDRALNEAIGARDKLAAENERKLSETEKEFKNAEKKLKKFESDYKRKMNRQVVAYMNRIGAQLEGIRNGDTISRAELDRQNALVTYGTAENLNDIEEKMKAAEKRRAIALGDAMKVKVEVCGFTDEFVAEIKKKTGNRVSKDEKGFELGNKIYLNENLIEAKTGYGTDYILMHEFGHVAELSADNHAKFSNYALKYMSKIHGAEYVDRWVEDVMKKRGISKAKAQNEIVAEFARTAMLTDPRAIRDLCKVAPKMSSRILQWLTNVKSNIFNSTIAQSSDVTRAQRWYARALKEVRLMPQDPTNIDAINRAEEAAKDANKVGEAEKTVAETKPVEVETPVEVEVEKEESSTQKKETKKKPTRTRTRTQTDTQASVAQTDTQESVQENVQEEQPVSETVEEPESVVPAEDFAEEEAPAQEQTEETKPVQLPFELSVETRQKIIRIVAEYAVSHSDAQGRVSSETNDMIRKMVKWQVTHDANYTETSEDILNAYADQFTRPQVEPEVAPVAEEEAATETQETPAEEQPQSRRRARAPRPVRFQFTIPQSAIDNINQWVEIVKNDPRTFSNEDIFRTVKRELEKAAKEQNKTKPTEDKIRRYAEQFYVQTRPSITIDYGFRAGNTQNANQSALPEVESGTRGERATLDPSEVANLQQSDINAYARNANFFTEFAFGTLADQYSVAELNDKYMPLAQKIVNGTATKKEIYLAYSYMSAVAMKKGVALNDDGTAPLDLYHGTPANFGFTKFRRGDRGIQRFLTFTSTNLKVANGYTYNYDSTPHVRKITDKLMIDTTGRTNDAGKMDLTAEDYEQEDRQNGRADGDTLIHDAKIVTGDVITRVENLSDEQYELQSNNIMQSAEELSRQIDAYVYPKSENIETYGAVVDALSDFFDEDEGDLEEYASDIDAYLNFSDGIIVDGVEIDFFDFADVDPCAASVANVDKYNKLNRLFSDEVFSNELLERMSENQYTAELAKFIRDGGLLQIARNIGDYCALQASGLDSHFIRTSTENGIKTVATADDLIDTINAYGTSGVYQLFGFTGENQYRQNAEGQNWNDISGTPWREYVSEDVENRMPNVRHPFDTNYSSDFNRKAGYTSTRFDNLYDSGSDIDGADEISDILIFYGQMGLKSSDVVTLDDKDNIIPLTERFNKDVQDIRYFTEMKSITSAMNEMSEADYARFGSPTVSYGANGAMVTRIVSPDGYLSGDPTRKGKRAIAVVAPASVYMDGDTALLRIPVDADELYGIAVPSDREYADIANDARERGLNVVTYDDASQFEAAQERVAETDTVNAFLPDDLTYEGFLKRYGQIRGGANDQYGRPVPRRTSSNNRVSRAFNTMMNSPFASDELAGDMRSWMVQNGVGTYAPQSNAKSLAKARSAMEKYGGVKEAANALHTSVATDTGKNTDLVALAEVLFTEIENGNNTLTDQERENIVSDLCILATDSGRAVQLIGALKNRTTEGHIGYVEQVGKRMASKYEKRTGKPTNLTLTEEEKAEYRKATTKQERDDIDLKVSKRWGEETSDLTFVEKLRNWRYFSMLANARTHFRNIAGNTLMIPIVRAKDAINTLYQGIDVRRNSDKVPTLSQADRTTSGITRTDAQTRAYVEGQLKAALPIMQGVSSKYIESAHKAVNSGNVQETNALKRIWNEVSQDVPTAHLANANGKNAFVRGIGKAFNKLSSINSNALEMEDALYLGLRFKSSMYQQIQAKGLDVANMTEAQQNQIVNYAMEEALRSTFRDASALADAINKFSHTNKALGYIVEGLVPFKKTPINIAKRAVEYSPLGLIQGAYKMLSNNAQYRKQLQGISEMKGISDSERATRLQELENSYIRERVNAIDRFAAGTTGSIMTALGILAASLGWISVKRNDDKGDAFETSLGKSGYSLNIGNTSIDLSAFSPAAVPLIIGATLYNILSDKSDSDGTPLGSAVISALCESINPITEMTVLSSFADAFVFNNYGEETNNTRTFAQFLGSAAGSYVGQFVPTIVGQAERTFDPYARSYSAGGDYWASKIGGQGFGTFAKNMQNKVGLGWLSEPKVNIHGEDQMNYTNFGSWVANALNQTILPASWKADQKNDVDHELVRLYGVVDNNGIFPQKPNRNVGSYKLTNDAEYAEYQKDYGQAVYDALTELMQSSAYAQMTDDEKASAIEDTIDSAKKAIRNLWKAKMAAKED